MNERDFNVMVDQLSLGTTPKEAAFRALKEAAFRAFSYSSAHQRGQNWRAWSDLQEMLNGDTQAALMNLRQSIYNVCVSCPPI